MKPWFEIREKTALIYGEQTWTYEDLEILTEAVGVCVMNAYGVLICPSQDPLKQLACMLMGLKNQIPVYFGSIEGTEALGKEDLSDHVFLIATTSGTTGRKKWVYKKAAQWLNSFKPHGSVFGITEDDVLFVNGSLAYTANLFSVLQIFHEGGTVVLSDDKNPKQWMKAMVHHGCTTAFLVPSKLRLLMKALPDLWPYPIEIVTAGEVLPVKLFESASKKCLHLRVHHYYGATELGHISAIRHEALKSNPGSVGQAFPGVAIEIQQGMIYGKSPYGSSLGSNFESAYDYGYVDEKGYLYVTGRKDSQINCHGRKFDAMAIVKMVSAKDEVETCLLVALEDSSGYGLYIHWREGVAETADCAWQQWMIEHIPPWQRPLCYFVDTKGLYSETGKYDMVKIRERLLKARN